MKNSLLEGTILKTIIEVRNSSINNNFQKIAANKIKIRRFYIKVKWHRVAKSIGFVLGQ